MSVPFENGQIRIWSPNGFLDNDWIPVPADRAVPDTGNFILPLAGYAALSEPDRSAITMRAGVAVEPGDDIRPLLPYLDQLPLIALSFPAFSDGRSYSIAFQLRDRYGYGSILRATGEILIDQVELLIRVGFDQLEISHETTLRRLDAGRTGGVRKYTQPAQRAENPSETYSWRRLPAA